jgi:hypothetical protein
MLRRLIQAGLAAAAAMAMLAAGSILSLAATSAEQINISQPVAQAANRAQAGGDGVNSAQLVRLTVSANRPHVMWVVSAALNVRQDPGTDRRPINTEPRSLSFASSTAQIPTTTGTPPGTSWLRAGSSGLTGSAGRGRGCTGLRSIRRLLIPVTPIE